MTNYSHPFYCLIVKFTLKWTDCQILHLNVHTILILYLDWWHDHSSEVVQPRDDVIPDLQLTPVLEVKHGDGWTEEVWEVVKQDQAVPEGGDGDVLQVVVLHGDVRWQLPGTDRFVGGPGQTVGWPTGHPVYLFPYGSEKKV